MKFIITESQKERIALKWMNMNYSPNQLEVVKSEKYPNSIFYRKNGKIVMEQNLKFKEFWFDYDDIWSFFETMFGMKYNEIQQLMETWLEETLNLEGFTPSGIIEWRVYRLEETLNLKGFTPDKVGCSHNFKLEETLNLEGFTPGGVISAFNLRWKRLSI